MDQSFYAAAHPLYGPSHWWHQHQYLPHSSTHLSPSLTRGSLYCKHHTNGFAHHYVPHSHLLHISFLQRGIPWPCRLHSNQHNIRRLHSSPISTNLLHICWPWPYNAEYPHLRSPVPITKTFFFFFFLLMLLCLHGLSAR